MSDRGTIHLIDCDSFQIRDRNRCFYCVVGVPQYTPPELQGRPSFRDFQRTPDHDCFGLALLVFHLLFMGRHPFAGRYSGSGDMTIERAISEGRFAFSRHAAQYQMATPPHAVALGTVTPQLAGMFERAFARVNGAPASRPSAAEWRHALSAAKATLTKCSTDPAHRFPRHLPVCPWCHIEEAGGPAFFVSAAGATTFDAGFDLLAAWSKIQRVPAPPGPNDLALPRRPSNLTATPIPLDARHAPYGEPRPLPQEPLLLLEQLPEFPPEPRPEEVPADPVLRVEPHPVLKEWVRPDFHAAARRLFERSLNSRDYRQAKWGTIAAAALTLGALVRPALAAVMGVLLVGLGSAWMIQLVPQWRKYRRALVEADRLTQAVERDRRGQEERHREQCEEVERQNGVRRTAWEQRVAHLRELRLGAPERDARRRETWEARLEEVRRVRDQVIRRNEASLAAYREAKRRFQVEWDEVERLNTAIAAARQRHQRERARREALVNSARIDLDNVRQEWAERAEKYAEEFKWAYIGLQTAKSNYDAMTVAYDRDLQHLKDNARAAQRKAFLQSHLIEDASVKGVGPGRKATLASYGIETADDLNRTDLESVPGFGPTLIGDLLAWKRDVLARFVYNPSKAVLPAELRALQMHYHAQKQGLQRTLRGGDEKLQGITARANRELAELTKRAEQRVRDLAQAELDLTLF